MPEYYMNRNTGVILTAKEAIRQFLDYYGRNNLIDLSIFNSNYSPTEKPPNNILYFNNLKKSFN